MPDNPPPIGAAVMPLETRIDEILYAIQRADELGYTAFFLPETWSFDVTVLMAAAAARTRRIKLGAGILGIWGRSAATIAMAAATLNILSDGRFILGLGSSSPELAEGWHDTSFEDPVDRLRRMVTQVRALLQGDRIPLQNVPEGRPLRLNLPPQPDLPIYMAATSPRSIRLTGELADGWSSFYTLRDRLSEHIALVKEGAARSGSKRQIQTCCALSTIVAEDPATARKGAAWVVSFYLTMMGSFYRNAAIRQGLGAEVASVLAANEGRRPALVPPEAEALLEQLTIYGTPEQAREQLAKWYTAGADMPSVMLNPNLSRDEMDLVLESCRPEVL